MSNRPFSPRLITRDAAWGRTAALTATGFGMFGFVLGLTFTLRGGDGADIAYHATMLPLLMLTAILLLRSHHPQPARPGSAH